MDAALQELIFAEDTSTEIEAIIRLLSGKNSTPPNIRILTQFGDIATCRIKIGHIPEVWMHESVISLKAPRLVTTELVHYSENEPAQVLPTRVNRTGFNGKGVVVGIIDWGFDFTHPNFIRQDGTSRFISIWDQTAPADVSSGKFGYGKVYKSQAINNALKREQPFKELGYHPVKGDPDGSGAHGTHVTDIAAGNGTVGEPGFGSGAEIIAVHLSAGRIEGLASLGDSVRLLEAIDFIAQAAGDRPLVINISIGRHGGSHQGNSLVEQGMDNFLKEKPGRAIVNSAGNYYRTETHTHGRLAPGGVAKFNWIVGEKDFTPNEMEIWYNHRDRFRVSLSPPGSSLATFLAKPGDRIDIVINGQLVGRVYHRLFEPNTGDHHIDIFLYQNAPKGIWTVQLDGEEVVDGRYHCWIERDSGCPGCQSRFDTSMATPYFTTGSICNGMHTIAVGAYDPYDQAKCVTGFSSAGPTADGRKKPNLLAPGINILAAKSAAKDAMRSDGVITYKSGTSMAAPHVTGAIAALFEKTGKIPIEITRNLLLSQLESPSAYLQEEEYRYGNGILDIGKLLSANIKDEPFEKSFDEQISIGYHKLSAMTSEAARYYFDHFTFGKEIAESYYPQNYEVIAYPGQMLNRELRGSEIIIKRAFGEGLAYAFPINVASMESYTGRLRRDTIILRPLDSSLGENAATAPDIRSEWQYILPIEEVGKASFDIFNKLLHKEKVSNCRVEISGVGNTVMGTTNRNGRISLDINGFPDGDYVLTVTPADTFNGQVGPATASAEFSSLPDRIWRVLTTQISIQKQEVIGIKTSTPASVSISCSSRCVKIGLQPVWIKSPNFSVRPSSTIIDTIIVHHTAGPVIGPALNTFLNRSEGVSAHYVIDTDGEIVKMVQDNSRSHHAGNSHWDGRNSVNNFSIGIEIVNRSGPYPNAQYIALIQLLRSLVATLNIPSCRIVGHSDIATDTTPPNRRLGRKSSDPGDEFDWARLEAAGLGIIISPNPQPPTIFGGFFNLVQNGSLRRGDSDRTQRYGGATQTSLSGIIALMQNELARIGYFCPQNGEFDKATELTVQMFQEHFFSGVRRSNAIYPGRVDFATATMMINAQTCNPSATTPATPTITTRDWEDFNLALPEDFADWDGYNSMTHHEICECEHQLPEDLGKSIQNLDTLRNGAASNQIAVIYRRISNETGLTHPSLPNNPLIGVTDDMITAGYNAHHLHGAITLPAVMMALWKKEGSDEHDRVVRFGSNGIAAQNAANAKTLFRSMAYYIEMGMDQMIHFRRVPGSDNQASFEDTDAAAHEIAFTTSIATLVREGYLARNISADINSSLGARQLGSGRFEVIPSNHFYIYSLLLMDALFRKNADQLNRISGLNGENDIGLTYMHWNMGAGNMTTFITSANRHRAETQYLINRQPISIVDWAFRRRLLQNEWKQPRENAIKFRYFAEIFTLMFT